MSNRGLALFGLMGIALLSLPISRLQAEPRAGLDLNALLDQYASGRFDAAVAVMARASDGEAMDMRLQWPIAGRKWIEADQASRSRRLVTAAAFALETEQVNAERGKWFGGPFSETKSRGFTVNGARVLSWAVQWIIERGTPDKTERSWWLAAIAVSQGVRDTRFLYLQNFAPEAFEYTTGIVQAALERFPNDPEFSLAVAMAPASAFDVTTDGEPRSPAWNWSVTAQGSTLTTSQGDLRSSISVRSNGAPTNAAAQLPRTVDVNRARYTLRDQVVATLSALASDTTVGVEARVRLGYVYWATGDDERAREELASATAATDPDLRYLANFLLGQAAWSAGDETAAVTAFTAALKARPYAQSAALALAALESQRGQGGTAAELVATAARPGNSATDPWRTFLYGHSPQWPALRDSLRQALSK